MILCIGAHPDDIELGAGAYLAYTREPKKGLCCTIESDFSWMAPEMFEAWKILEIENINCDQNFTLRNFDRQGLLETLYKLREHKPRIVITHGSMDTHQDHKVVHEESVRAFKYTTILGYNFEWNNVRGDNSNFYKAVDRRYVDLKLKAIACYDSQQHRNYFNPDYQLWLLKTNGMKCGVEFAEKFEVIRWIE